MTKRNRKRHHARTECGRLVDHHLATRSAPREPVAGMLSSSPSSMPITFDHVTFLKSSNDLVAKLLQSAQGIIDFARELQTKSQSLSDAWASVEPEPDTPKDSKPGRLSYLS